MEKKRRSYAISSAIGEQICITVKRVENGEFSSLLISHAKKGDILLTSGVSGMFLLRDDLKEATQYFFIAAGSGITACFSMIKTLSNTLCYICGPFEYIRMVHITLLNRIPAANIFKENSAHYTVSSFPGRQIPTHILPAIVYKSTIGIAADRQLLFQPVMHLFKSGNHYPGLVYEFQWFFINSWLHIFLFQ
ncbi:hypothetical protein BH11BAC4_BH11BAC4_02040 [soil metagenome]